MPSASAKSSMSLGELAICQDFLDGHREYAIDLLSNIEKLGQWHATDSCLEARRGRVCSLCGICSADGLMGATKMALAAYDDAEECLKTVRASLGKSAVDRATPGRQTWFRNPLAKSVFVSVVSAGDALRSQHATWRALLQSEVASSPTSTKSPRQTNTGHGELDEHKRWDLLLPTYSGPTVADPEVDPKLTALSSSSLTLETTSSSTMFVVFRRCLSLDCPCDLNKANVAAKTRSSKTPAKSEVITREENVPLSPTLNMALSTREAESSSGCGASIVDTRISRLRAVIARFDEVRGTLIAWCQVCATGMLLDPRAGPGTEPETLLTHGTHGYPSALTPGSETAEPTNPLCATGHSRQGTTEGPTHGNDMAAQELRFDGKEKLEERWLMARRERRKALKRCSSRLVLR